VPEQIQGLFDVQRYFLKQRKAVLFSLGYDNICSVPSLFNTKTKYRLIMKVKSGWLLCLTLAVSSCRTPGDVTYLQGIDRISQEQREAMSQTYDTKICEDDMLTIGVSSQDPTVVMPFNPPAYGFYSQGETDASSSIQNLYAYLVDRDGNISFPVIGIVHLGGLNVQEANAKLEELIRRMAPDAIVSVQIVNFRVGIFGEVARNNMYTVRKSRVSILELITLAGDLTINANRKNILLIREADGKKEFVRFDITDPAIFSSPYFYLKQNDMVYVEPNKAKKKNANYSAGQSYTFSIAQTIMTGVSVVSTIVSVIIASKK
jgi:polysaccharide export outer membrane protein